MNNHNPKSRAIVSALRSGIPALRATAVQLVDEALKDAATNKPTLAVQLAFEASNNTAKAILTERAKFTSSGRKRSGAS